jgi:hypothetical protein
LDGGEDVGGVRELGGWDWDGEGVNIRVRFWGKGGRGEVMDFFCCCEGGEGGA